jgi:carbonic anhydrase/acetyltransferase-like protein (isoleucine patch superfamily)
MLHIKKKAKTIIGNNVSIGHNSIIHGCTVEDNVLIGMGSIVMDDCIIEKNSIVAAGCVLTKGTVVNSGSVYGGIPGRKIKSITDENIEEIKKVARNYIVYSSWFK